MKHLPLALATAAIAAACSKGDAIVHADSLELIHVDTVSQTLNLTVVSEDGERTTIVFTPSAAVQAQEAMARTILLTVEAGEALHAQQQSPAPAP